MNGLLSWSYLRAGAVFVCMGALASAAMTHPKLINRVAPVHPPELMEKGVDGAATVSFRVTADGSVSDIVVTEASEPAFGEAASAAVAQWKFEPAKRDGAPVSIKVAQEFKFTVPTEKKLEAAVGRPVFVNVKGEVIAADKLAQPPHAILPVRPIYPQVLAGSGQTAAVDVSFVINTEGVAVNPKLLSNDVDSLFATYALVSVLHAKWEPVVHDGKPVNVEMGMTIRMKEPPASASPPAAAPKDN